MRKRKIKSQFIKEKMFSKVKKNENALEKMKIHNRNEKIRLHQRKMQIHPRKMNLCQTKRNKKCIWLKANGIHKKKIKSARLKTQKGNLGRS